MSNTGPSVEFSHLANPVRIRQTREDYFAVEPNHYLPAKLANKTLSTLKQSKAAFDIQIAANVRYELITNPVTKSDDRQSAREAVGGLRIGHSGIVSKEQMPVTNLDGILAAAYHPRYAHGVSSASTAKVRQNLLNVKQCFETADQPVLSYLLTMNAALLLEYTAGADLIAQPSYLRQRDNAALRDGKTARWDLTARSTNRTILPVGEYHVRTSAVPALAPGPHQSITNAAQITGLAATTAEAFALAKQLLSDDPERGDFKVLELASGLLSLMADAGSQPMIAQTVAAESASEPVVNWLELARQSA